MTSDENDRAGGIRRIRALFTRRPPEEQARALKERIYASFTGLAVVTALSLEDHSSPSSAFLTLLAAIVGIVLAGLVAEIVSHQVMQARLPNREELAAMLRIAAGALGSASVSLIALLVAWAGWIDLRVALQVSIGIYFVTLALVTLVATHRTNLPWHQHVVSLLLLAGLGVAVVAVLVLAH